jgi:hypothetical protein
MFLIFVPSFQVYQPSLCQCSVILESVPYKKDHVVSLEYIVYLFNHALLSIN